MKRANSIYSVVAAVIVGSGPASAQSLADGMRLRALSKEGTVLQIEPVLVSPGTPCQTKTKKITSTSDGIIVEVIRPKEGCNFSTLKLEINGSEYPISAVAGFSFKDGKYAWGEGTASGDLLFSTPKDLSKAALAKLKIVGLSAPNTAESLAHSAQQQREAAVAENYQRELKQDADLRARGCTDFYPGKVGKVKGEGFLATSDAYIVRYVNADRGMATIEGTSGGNSLKSGETIELNCYYLLKRSGR